MINPVVTILQLLLDKWGFGGLHVCCNWQKNCTQQNYIKSMPYNNVYRGGGAHHITWEHLRSTAMISLFNIVIKAIQMNELGIWRPRDMHRPAWWLPCNEKLTSGVYYLHIVVNRSKKEELETNFPFWLYSSTPTLSLLAQWEIVLDNFTILLNQ